jgi:hypothetical protein
LNQFGATNMMRLPALLALVAVSTTAACAPEMKGAAIAGGVAMTVAGALVASGGVVDADHNGVNENPLDDDWGAYMLGGVLLTAGVTMALAGIAATVADSSPAPHAPPRVVYAPPPMAYVPQPGRASLPELATNSDALRDAQQIRSMAENRECGGAWMTWHRLDANDHAYAVAVRDSAVMAPCPVDVVAPMP